VELKKEGKCCQLLCSRDGYIGKDGDYSFCPIHAREILAVHKDMVKLDERQRETLQEIASMKD